MNKTDWEKELPEELDFWKQWFDTKGLIYPPDFINRQNPDLEIEDEFKVLFGDLLPGMKILDAGCGPLTILGKKYNGIKLDITCTDILANEYNKLMDDINFVPLIKPLCVGFEELSEYFGDIKFDFIHAVNCIDHSYDPIASISGLLSALKPNGFLYIRHLVNEANRGSFNGLHKWNFYVENGDFIISGINGKKINVNNTFKETATIKSSVHDGKFNLIIISHIIKK